MRRGFSIFILLAAGLGAGAALQGGLTAQASQASQGQDILPALLIEVRGLRAAMEQMATSGPRVQLALGRLQLQEQRVNNLLRRLETARAGLAGAQRDEEKNRQELALREESMKSAPEGMQRALEQVLATEKVAHARAATELQRLQVEESGIVQELASEQGRWSDINQRMEELERALTKKWNTQALVSSVSGLWSPVSLPSHVCCGLWSLEDRMRLHTLTLAGALALGAALSSSSPRAANAPRPGVDWPQFRGISATGISEGVPTPSTWNVAAGTNVLWKTAIPGLGLSSPVVWGDQLFVSTAISGDKGAGVKPGLYGDIKSVTDDTPHEWRVYALNKKTGAILWQKTAHTGVPKIKRHTKNSHANSTLATDGEHLVAFFGSEGVYAYDLKGKLLWQKDLGVLDAGFYMVPEAQWETGSSPVIHDGVVIIQADVQKGSFLAAFEREGRPRAVARGADRRPDVGHAHRARRGRTASGHRQWHAPRRRVRLQDRQGSLEALGRRRHPRPDPRRQRRAHLHHERARTDVAHLCDPRQRSRRHQPCRGCVEQYERRLELRARRRLHVHAAGRTAASSTSSSTTAS